MCRGIGMIEKMQKYAVCAIALPILLAGCMAHYPQMTREEWKQTTTRQYDGVKHDDVFNAAEKLFRLADGDDFIVAHQENSMNASRPWTVYLVLAASFGVDSWNVEARSDGEKTLASVFVSQSNGAAMPMPTTQANTYSVGGGSGMGIPIRGTAIYDVFWARMDWLLGKRKDWMTCKEADERVKANIVWGENHALCNKFNIKDIAPTENDRLIKFVGR